MSCICLGPKRSGKTHLLKALQEPDSIDETSYSMPTIGTGIYRIHFPTKSPNSDKPKPPPADGSAPAHPHGSKHLPKSIQILEIGGSMAPLWRQYFEDVKKLIYVVDTSNLCQISAAGVLFYSILTEPRLQKVKILLVLAKMDYSYRQMRNEALLMLQMSKLQKQIRQQVTIVEASAVNKVGLDAIYEWLQRQ
ncbi:ADP-ribosylation factor-like protein 16 [Drosophila guanche]|uniref:Blast:ADP-ribosylation factor-like protein 16 n=1 Tax=Drosophila guanche TaxID=7266 RepID=A0A3B0JBH6_DROGU|nr:ADP-ribosylation factor-like protein 16 [Drosophila guanche]SPP79704.1 blast:ADP-ribosylation factor-like protein 16 [Drosophila guanche]